jgi:preprotein translocase subunit SecF
VTFDFVGRRKYWYILSLLIIIPGIISLFVQGLNEGIDFTGGNLMEVRFEKDVSVEQVRNILKDFNLENSPVQSSGQREVIIRTRELSEQESEKVIAGLREKAGDLTVLRNEHVAAVISRELTGRALAALGIASVLMLIYISWRFEFKQGVAAVAALLHDGLITLGAFSLLQLEVDSSFVAAVLTVLGYSINDTIIIFDRIRENSKGALKGKPVEELVNVSIRQTLARSINTVLAVVFMLLALLFFGGTTIKVFVTALLIGVISGAYSSIFTASPLWVDLKKRFDGAKQAGRVRA